MTTDLYTGGEYARLHPDWHREHSPWKASKINELLLRNEVRPKTVAEIGCGAGEILASLQKELPYATSLVGYDIAPAAFALTRHLENANLRFVLGDMIKISPPPVDLLLTIDVAEHIEDYLGFLRAIKPRAKYHIFHLPLDLSLLSMLQAERLKWARNVVGHLHFFTAETALQALSNAGYITKDYIYTSVELDLPTSEQQQRLRILRRIGRRISPAWTSRTLGGFSAMVLCTNDLGDCRDQ